MKRPYSLFVVASLLALVCLPVAGGSPDAVADRVMVPTNGPGTPRPGWVVTNSVPATNEISFEGFLDEVAQANLDYAAQRYNVAIAKAALAIAREFPNPILNLGGAKDVRNWDRSLPDQNGRLVSQSVSEPLSVGIVQPIEYFSKRKWRVQVADHAYRAAAATLEDFLRNLKLDASAAFAEALATQRTLEQQRKAADYLGQLVLAQQRRFQSGDISETDFTQSRVEELQFQEGLLNAQNDAQVAQLALHNFLGRSPAQTTFILRGNLELEPRSFDLPQLLVNALQERTDLAALRHARDGAQSAIRLAGASRVPDVNLGLNYIYTSGSDNFASTAQPDSMVGLSLSFPLPLWNRQSAEIQSARLAAQRAQTTLESAELKAEVQVRQAVGTYQLMTDRVQKFRSELLTGADGVLAAKRFGYEHGQATLLDLLEAQRTANSIRQAYNDALADAAKALIELERAAQLWDVSF
jgi:cobalt-zinc-cadmium efflux system outer membrane protein